MITFLKCFCKAFYENFLAGEIFIGMFIFHFLPAVIFIGGDGSFECQLVIWFFLIPDFLVDVVQMSFVISDSMWEFRRAKERCE